MLRPQRKIKTSPQRPPRTQSAEDLKIISRKEQELKGFCRLGNCPESRISLLVHDQKSCAIPRTRDCRSLAQARSSRSGPAVSLEEAEVCCVNGAAQRQN